MEAFKRPKSKLGGNLGPEPVNAPSLKHLLPVEHIRKMSVEEKFFERSTF